MCRITSNQQASVTPFGWHTSVKMIRRDANKLSRRCVEITMGHTSCISFREGRRFFPSGFAIQSNMAVVSLNKNHSCIGITFEFRPFPYRVPHASIMNNHIHYNPLTTVVQILPPVGNPATYQAVAAICTNKIMTEECLDPTSGRIPGRELCHIWSIGHLGDLIAQKHVNSRLMYQKFLTQKALKARLVEVRADCRMTKCFRQIPKIKIN